MTSSHSTAGQDANQKAVDCLRKGDLSGAKVHLVEATKLDPSHQAAWTNLAGVLRNLGEYDAALKAVEGALRVDPRSFFALFFRATILETIGQERAAAAAYATSFLVAPPLSAQDDATKTAIKTAKALVDRVARSKADFINDHLGTILTAGAVQDRQRAEILVGNLTGLRKAYPQEPLLFNYPHLPAIEFWDRDEFPWLAELESATEAIIGEFQHVLNHDAGNLTPYIHYGEGLPIDQWANLNHNPDWSAYHLIEAGDVVADHANRCPATMAALAKVPFPKLPGRSPVAMFSLLKPKTHIPPHTGASNARLLCHLPLIVPDRCRYRVGGSWRDWKVGEAFIFDDTIEHEAFNDSDHLRTVLIFDVWNPRLTETDRAIITQTTLTLDAFNGTTGSRADWT
jgi:aspartate beta-hydroxylase